MACQIPEAMELLEETYPLQYSALMKKLDKVAIKPTEVKESTAVNIWSTDKNGYEGLSNFAKRPFEYKGKQYNSVEHAYQVWKSGNFDSKVDDVYRKSGRTTKVFGGIPVNKSISESLMKELILESFQQNEEAKALLLSTGNAELTHKGGKDKFWENKFPEILMEVRSNSSKTTAMPKKAATKSAEKEGDPVRVNYDNALGSEDYENTVDEYATLPSGLVSELNSENPRYGKSPITIVEVSNYNGKTKVKYTYPKSTKVYSTVSLNQKDTKATIQKYIDARDRMYSEPKGKLDKSPEDLRKDALKSLQGILDIGQELYAEDKITDTEHKDYLMKLLGSIDMDFMREMNLYLKKQAQKNRGMIDTSDIVIETSEKDITHNNEMGGLEVYAHEMKHAYSKFAIAMSSKNSEAYEVVRKIKALRDRAAKIVKWEDLLPEQSLNKELEEAEAKKRYKYIFHSDNGLHEFIAHGTTHKPMMDKLAGIKLDSASEKTTILDKLRTLASRLMDIILGNLNWKSMNKDAYSQLMELTVDLAGFNNKAVENIQKEKGAISKISEGIDTVNKKWEAKVDELSEKLKGSDITPPPRNASRLEYAKWMAKWLPQLILREDLAHYRAMILKVFGQTPEGMIQNIGRDVSTNVSDLERIVEQLSMDSKQIDRVREDTARATKKVFKDMFNTKPTKTEMEAIKLVMLDTDMAAVYNKYGIDVLKGKNLQKAIDEVKSKLKELDPNNYNWNTIQADGLGYYMATHKAGRAQLLNASNIANGVLSGSRREASQELIDTIDELATLEGLKYTRKEAKELFIEVAESNPEAIQHLSDTMNGYKKRSRELIFNTDVNMIKGYSKELFDDSIQVAIRPVDEQDNMEAQGYKLVEKLGKDRSDTSEKPMAMYVNSTFGINSYNKGSMRLTDMMKRGTSLEDIAKTQNNRAAQLLADRDKRVNIKLLQKEVEQMKNGTYNREQMGDGLNAILDESGNATGFRYMMSKDKKKEVLKQDIDASEVLGRTVAALGDKIDTDIQNKATLEVIWADMKENYEEGENLGKNKSEYIKISKDSPVKEVREIYRLIPEKMKYEISKSELGYIAVRRDMLHNYFGFRDMSIMDIGVLNNWTPAVMKHTIKMLEAIWQEIVSISKVDVVIRMPIVLLANIMSNTMYSIIYGPTNPAKVAKKSLMAWRNIKEYLDEERVIRELEAEQLAGKDHKDEISRRRNELSGNPVHKLMDAGMYQAIIEDVDMKDRKSSSRLARKINEKTEGMPEFVKQGVHWLYLDEQTSYFQMMTQATQLSDFVARVTQYELMKEKGVDEKTAREHVLDTFINYDKPASSMEEYLNNMGLIMFTKYMKRIQRVIAKDVKSRPLNVLLAVIGQEIFMDVSDIHEQSVFVRNWSTIGINPWDHIERAATPTVLQFAGIVR